MGVFRVHVNVIGVWLHIKPSYWMKYSIQEKWNGDLIRPSIGLNWICQLSFYQFKVKVKNKFPRQSQLQPNNYRSDQLFVIWTSRNDNDRFNGHVYFVHFCFCWNSIKWKFNNSDYFNGFSMYIRCPAWMHQTEIQHLIAWFWTGPVFGSSKTG